MNNKAYDILKWLAAPGLPAVAAFLVTMGEILNQQPFSIAGAIVAALATMFGAWTGSASRTYFESHDIVEKKEV